MRNFKVVIYEGKYGIYDGNTQCVPSIWDTLEEAAGEWQYYQLMNNLEQFLDYVLTKEQIDEEFQKLLKQEIVSV